MSLASLGWFLILTICVAASLALRVCTMTSIPSSFFVPTNASKGRPSSYSSFIYYLTYKQKESPQHHYSVSGYLVLGEKPIFIILRGLLFIV